MEKGKRCSLKISLGIIILFISVIAGLRAGTERDEGRGTSGNWSAIELISTESDDSSTSYCDSIFVDSAETVHLIWIDYSDYNGCGSDMDIFYKKKDLGGTWSTTEVVTTESDVNARTPQLTVDSGGTVHVSWHEAGYLRYKQKPTGGSWTSPELITVDPQTGIHSLVTTPDMGVHVVYDKIASGSSEMDVFYKKRLSGGFWLGTELVSTESTEDAYGPSMSVDSNNTIHIAWTDTTNYNGAGSDADIFYRKKDPVSGWTTTEVVSTESTTDSIHVSMDLDAEGTIHIVWRENLSLDFPVFYKCKPLNGSWSTLDFITSTHLPSGLIPIDTGDDGTVHVAWDDDLGGDDWDIFYKKKLGNGSWSQPEVVSTESTENARSPSLVLNPAGIVHIAWGQSDDDPGSGSDWDIFYRKNIPFNFLYVDDDNTPGPWYGTIDYPFERIQDGIDAAADGMTVIVGDGTYTGSGNRDLNFNGRAITLRSKNGPAHCIIDIGSGGRGFYFNNSEDPDSVLMGFTIRNGYLHHDLYGAGIYCEWASPTIVNNIIRDNYTWGDGGAIYCEISSPTIKNNLIIGNYAYNGGGIGCNSFSSPNLINNTIIGNTASQLGGGIYLYDFSSPNIVNTILWNNSASTGNEIYCPVMCSPRITYCDIQGGYSGTGNIDADPLFVSGPLGAYYLSQIAAGQALDSPCVDTGSGPAQWPCFENPLLGTVCGTTRTDLELDMGFVDMGYHYPSSGIHLPPGGRRLQQP